MSCGSESVLRTVPLLGYRVIVTLVVTPAGHGVWEATPIVDPAGPEVGFVVSVPVGIAFTPTPVNVIVGRSPPIHGPPGSCCR